MSVLRLGNGRPVTLIAPGEGCATSETRVWADGLTGRQVVFAYEESGRIDELRHLRRQADRDAGEVAALAEDHDATRAIGVSRGARAVLGALAEDPGLFDRVVLVVPPSGRAVGRYTDVLRSDADRLISAAVLVIGRRGDPGHPARVARAWAEALGAALEVLPSGAQRSSAWRRDRTDLLGGLISDFLAG